MAITDEQLRQAFNLLENQLRGAELPVGDGRFREVSADEFMYMGTGEESKYLQFKHRYTRNYVFIRPDGTMMIPSNGQPFQRGEFGPSMKELEREVADLRRALKHEPQPLGAGFGAIGEEHPAERWDGLS